MNNRKILTQMIRLILVCCLIIPLAIAAQWTQLGGDINGAAEDDNSGYSVSLSADGSIVAIGSPFNGKAGEMAGMARVYKIENGIWTQLGSDILGEKEFDNFAHSVSLSADGTRLAVGAQFATNQAFGNAKTFECVSGEWKQLGQTIIGEAPGDQSGYAVALSSDGNTFAIGAIDNDGNGLGSGHVRVHKFNGLWGYIGRDIEGENAYDVSGGSVTLSADGNIIAIGAVGNDDNGNSSGQVRVYKLIGTKWTKVGADIDGEAANDQCGISVSLSSDGKTLAIGAIGNDVNGSNSGSTRVFQLVDTSWVQVGANINGEAAGDQAGVSVSLSSDGTKIAIGANMNDGRLSNSGHVRVYQLEADTWKQIGADINGEAPGDQSGVSVSLSADGTIVAIGANGNDGNGGNSGHMRVYKFNTVIASDDITNDNHLALTVVPNPIIENATILIKGFEDAQKQITITDLLGKEVFITKLQKTENLVFFDLDKFRIIPGIYFVRISDTMKQKSGQMIISK
ncbi:MAG: T9SS type A sorting domain-containing protein [Saprospiraceae bacterium]|nr:T9SS type A sorting domain-containing protein [Saprospiraceae bacterium]